jgi:putative hydrolase of the HAD superfamily
MKPDVCVVFDIDDTLYLEREYVQSGFGAVDEWAARWLDVPDFAERCWCAFEAGQRQFIFDTVLRQSGVQPSPGLIASLVALYRAHVPLISLAPDAYNAIAGIARTASIAVISDGPAASQTRKAEALRLSAFADPIILTELLGLDFAKPHARAFETVQELRPAARYLYVADNPLKDFAAPKQLGWLTVRVRRKYGLHYSVENPDQRPDFEMPDCSTLPHLIKQL